MGMNWYRLAQQHALDSWWLDLFGRLYELAPGGDDHHGAWAVRYCRQNKIQLLQSDWDPEEEALDALLKLGWIRLIKEGQKLWVDHRQGKKPTDFQLRSIRKLSIELGCSSVVDTLTNHRYANTVTATYAPEIGMLNQYLKTGFDPYDYTWELENEYLKGFGEWCDMAAEEWIEKASPEDLKEFRDFIENRQPRNTADVPVYEHLAYERFVTPCWLIHFTSEAADIAENGFRFGFDSMQGLGLTTWYTDAKRKSGPGFNFAYPAESKKALEREDSYGSEAVIFWGGGVHGYHTGDEESQIIFWGPSIRKDMIFPLYKQGQGLWECRHPNGRVIIGGRDLKFLIPWVIANRSMLQSILKREK